jgi:hypothetical protein
MRRATTINATMVVAQRGAGGRMLSTICMKLLLMYYFRVLLYTQTASTRKYPKATTFYAISLLGRH